MKLPRMPATEHGPYLQRAALRTLVIVSLLALVAGCASPSPRASLTATKRAAYAANYRNDQAGLRTAIASFAVLEKDRDLGGFALYYAGWSEWMLATSQLQDKQPAAATTTLESAAAHLKRALEIQPDDAEAHTVLVFTLVALTAANPGRWQELAPEISLHRRRALALAPHNPRTLIMDAMMIFYAPPQYGGGQEKGIARWLEAQPLFDAEKIPDPAQPDWGRPLTDGWLANLYLAMSPPHPTEARQLAGQILSQRPDYWFVKTQVMPKLPQP